VLRIPPRILQSLWFERFLGRSPAAELPRLGLRLPPDALRARRRLVLGTARAARAVLARHEPGPVVWADAETARRAFADAPEDPGIALLCREFLPTVLLHDGESGDAAVDLHWWRDAAPPRTVGKGILGVTADSRRRHRIAGEVMLVPPAHRGEGRRRVEWLREVGLEPPAVQDPLGPYWSLGELEAWWIEVIGWRERLVLAGLLGTRMPAAVVVGGPDALPRIGYVVEKARELGRALVGVPLAAVPEDLRAALATTRTVRWRGPQGPLLSAGEIVEEVPP
jgi:hypothetical protein